MSLLDFLFGCWHKRFSFPITAKAAGRRNAAAALTGTYVVCLDCGQEFPYDWKRMRVLTRVPKAARGMTEAVEPIASKAA